MMKMNDEIKRAICELTVVTQTNLGAEVTLPIFYPDGELATVTIAADKDGRYLVHDASSGTMNLSALGMNITASLSEKYREYARKYGCEYDRGRVYRVCERSQIAIVAALVANASKAIADQSLEAKRKIDTAFREAVADQVHSRIGKRVRDDISIKGKSGTVYRVHHVILDARRRKRIAFVEPSASRNVVHRHFAEFSDLKPKYDDVRRISIYNENALKKEDINLLGEVSEVATLPASERVLSELAH